MLHTGYHQSLRGEDGEQPIEAKGSPSETNMNSYHYSGAPTKPAETASLSRCSRSISWPTFTSPTCEEPVWVQNGPLKQESRKHIQPTWRVPLPQGQPMALSTVRHNCWASCYLDPKIVTALSKAVRTKFGITEPLTNPAMASPSPGLTSLADDLKRARLSRLLPKVTSRSPFHPCVRTGPMAELQAVTVFPVATEG